ncbi:hypothetical protein [Picrophilus oshimae]|uniref:hypothetical protein n=1 Tax=Picrophilus oshimae TaxID=46632 RepID=UPI00064F2ABC|nr:hypothetical protein [Picrophilus oshimae]
MRLKLNVVGITSIIVEAILIIGIFFAIMETIVEIILNITEFYVVADYALEGSLFIVVLIEIYLSVMDFFSGKGRSLIYIIDASIAFVLREIIIEIVRYGLNIGIYTIASIVVLIVSLTFVRLIIIKSKS